MGDRGSEREVRAMAPVVAVGVLVVVTAVAAVGVPSLAAGEHVLLGEDQTASDRDESVTPGMALSLVIEGDTVTVHATDGSRVSLASLTLVVRWDDQLERVPFTAGTLVAADGELGPGDEWSWNAGCALPDVGSEITLQVVHEPSAGVVTGTTRPVERGLPDQIEVEPCSP